MKYRIIKNHRGYFPQVKRYFRWKTIVKHPYGYGLYPQTNYEYPHKTLKECEKVMNDYKEFVAKSTKITMIKKY